MLLIACWGERTEVPRVSFSFVSIMPLEGCNTEREDQALRTNLQVQFLVHRF